MLPGSCAIPLPCPRLPLPLWSALRSPRTNTPFVGDYVPLLFPVGLPVLTTAPRWLATRATPRSDPPIFHFGASALMSQVLMSWVATSSLAIIVWSASATMAPTSRSALAAKTLHVPATMPIGRVGSALIAHFLMLSAASPSRLSETPSRALAAYGLPPTRALLVLPPLLPIMLLFGRGSSSLRSASAFR